MYVEQTWTVTVWTAGNTDGGGYEKCMYVEPPGEVDMNYKHKRLYFDLPT